MAATGVAVGSVWPDGGVPPISAPSRAAGAPRSRGRRARRQRCSARLCCIHVEGWRRPYPWRDVTVRAHASRGQRLAPVASPSGKAGRQRQRELPLSRGGLTPAVKRVATPWTMPAIAQWREA